MQEVWKEIPGFPGYWISNYGDIKGIKGDFLTLHPRKKDGYVYVWLHKSNGKVYSRKIHRLVLLTFIGPSDLEVDHFDFNRSNNRLDNLSYKTPKQNSEHTKLYNRTNKGERNGQARLTQEQIDAIRDLYPTHTQQELATMFNTSRPNISLIVNKINWS